MGIRRTRRPVVGVVGHGLVVRRPFGDLPVIGTPQPYVDQIAAVGLRPVVVPGAYGIDLLDLIDALVLTGGGDLDPALSGVDPEDAQGVDRSRDDAELSLVRAAYEQKVPLLGCCRGLQVMAVAFGGTLRSVGGHIEPVAGHKVHTAAGSKIANLVGPIAQTTALHQQAIDEPGGFWRPTAWVDDIIEAIEPDDDSWPAVGVQWHPELSGTQGFSDETGPALFAWLSHQAAERALTR